jgi:hypothetical protein
MDGSHVLATTFGRQIWGYSTVQVDELLSHAGRDLAAGVSPEARIREARFERTYGYDVCAVDLFLADLWRLGTRSDGDAWQEMTVGHQRRTRLTTERGEVMTSAWGRKDNSMSGRLSPVHELRGPDATTLLSISGSNLDLQATASISFGPDDFLRFPVGGFVAHFGIMTAVDGQGTRVAWYRMGSSWSNLEIAVNPEWELTKERIAAIAMAAPFFLAHFRTRTDGSPEQLR